MDSQEWAAEFPTVSVKIAKIILKSHGWDSDTVREYANCLWLYDRWLDNTEQIAEIDQNEEVNSQQLINWLGY